MMPAIAGRSAKSRIRENMDDVRCSFAIRAGHRLERKANPVLDRRYVSPVQTYVLKFL
jgi:hypothetical protein